MERFQISLVFSKEFVICFFLVKCLGEQDIIEILDVVGRFKSKVDLSFQLLEWERVFSIFSFYDWDVEVVLGGQVLDFYFIFCYRINGMIFCT